MLFKWLNNISLIIIFTLFLKLAICYVVVGENPKDDCTHIPFNFKLW